MKRRLLPVFLLVALAACGTDPNAARTAGAGGDSASPTPAASSPAATDSTLSVTRPSTSATTAKTTAGGLAEGTVVILPGDGVTFSSAGQITTTTWLTAEAKVFLVAELGLAQAADGTCATITVTGYRVSDLVNGSEYDCGGGAAVLWGKTSTGWKQVLAGQDVPMCSDVRKSGWKTTIPRDFLGGQCYEGSEVIDYKP